MNKLITILLTATVIGVASGDVTYAGPRGGDDTKDEKERGKDVGRTPATARRLCRERTGGSPARPQSCPLSQDPPRFTPGPPRVGKDAPVVRLPSTQPGRGEPSLRTLPELRGGLPAVKDKPPAIGLSPRADIPNPGLFTSDKKRSWPRGHSATETGHTARAGRQTGLRYAANDSDSAFRR